MYDDASWYSIVPQASEVPKDQAQTSKHRRRESLLKQSNEVPQAGSEAESRLGTVAEDSALRPQGPPPASIARRAQSYNDFYDVVRGHLQKKNDVDKNKSKGRRPVDLQTETDFGDWYLAVEEELLDASHGKYRLSYDQLDTIKSHLDHLSHSTASALDVLSDLSESFETVEDQCTLFRGQCEDIIANQRRATQLATDLDENLQYYGYLDPISRRLNAPSASSMVRSREFSEMLATLDHCLKYMQSNHGHKEAENYRAKYRLLMTRALTLVRNHFVTSLREISSEVTKRIADRQLNDTTMSALLYAKFRVGATELKGVGKEVQKRAMISDDDSPGAEAEYQSLVNELYQNYSATRGKLVIPLVRKKIASIAVAPSTAKDLVAFARSSIGYIRGVCSDEYELWGDWFEGDDSLYLYLESVCEPLYDHLRPRIIHENQIMKLCELCTLLQSRWMHDQEEDAEVLEPGQLDFFALIQPVLEDTQTRLVFRAQAILRDEIERYRPQPADLDFPARNRSVPLSGSQSTPIATRGRKKSLSTATLTVSKPALPAEDAGDETEMRDIRWGYDRDARPEGWYPTLRKAIWLLSRIYRLVNSTVFDDLAHRIVHQTTRSLHQAATTISSAATPVDGQLFLIKHLLILKSQIMAFDIEFVTPDISLDFSEVTNTFWELRERGGLFNPRSLMRFVGGGLLPRVVENMLDAKVELDGRIRTVINDFTSHFAKQMTQPINSPSASKTSSDGADAVSATRAAIEKGVPPLRQKLDEYLDDARTKDTLVMAVHDQIVQLYEDFHALVRSHAQANGRVGSSKGKGREDEVWDVGTFAEWSAEVFGVGPGRFESGEAGGRSRSLSTAGST